MRLRGVVMMTMLAALGLEARADEIRVLTDFPAGARALPWKVVNDNVMGGRSRGSFRLTRDALRFSGSTNTQGGGFSSIRTEASAFDLSGYDGIRLRVRGDGRTYTFRLTTADTRREQRRPTYRAEFETQRGKGWQEIELPFAAFTPRWRGRRLAGPALNTGAIDGLGLMIYDKKDGAFRLDVDWIRAYRQAAIPALDTLRQRNHALVVFAPNAKDRRLKRQLELIRQDRTELDERNIVVIVALGDGDSRIDDEPLDRGVVEALQRRFDVAPKDFAVRLVGKDGLVKRSSADVTWMSGLLLLLDAKPR